MAAEPRTDQPAGTTPPAGVRLYTAGEVAAMFRVDPKTVARWDDEHRMDNLMPGIKSVIRTPGQHRRYDSRVIDALISGQVQFNAAP